MQTLIGKKDSMNDKLRSEISILMGSKHGSS